MRVSVALVAVSLLSGCQVRCGSNLSADNPVTDQDIKGKAEGVSRQLGEMVDDVESTSCPPVRPTIGNTFVCEVVFADHAHHAVAGTIQPGTNGFAVTINVQWKDKFPFGPRNREALRKLVEPRLGGTWEIHCGDDARKDLTLGEKLRCTARSTAGATEQIDAWWNEDQELRWEQVPAQPAEAPAPAPR